MSTSKEMERTVIRDYNPNQKWTAVGHRTSPQGIVVVLMIVNGNHEKTLLMADIRDFRVVGYPSGNWVLELTYRDGEEERLLLSEPSTLDTMVEAWAKH